jgi:hypothetical protein
MTKMGVIDAKRMATTTMAMSDSIIVKPKSLKDDVSVCGFGFMIDR